MLRFACISIVLSFILLGNAFVIQADEPDTPEKSDNEKTEEAKPDEKESTKVYDLKPKYTEDMSWNEEVKLESVLFYDYSGNKTSKTELMTMKLKTELSEFKNDIPTKVKYSDGNGNVKVTQIYGNNNENSYEYDITKCMVEADVDSDLTLKVTKSEKLTTNMIGVFPGNLLSWFAAPIRPMKIGDTWSSKELPVYKTSFESDEGKFEDIYGKFTLEKISKKDDIEFAHILWEGKCNLTKYKTRGPYDVAWKFKIVFDLTNGHVISSDGEASAVLSSSGSGGLKLKINRKATYAEKVEPKKEAPIKPKNEDDE